MATLKFSNSGEEFELEEDSPIAEKCEEQGIPFACTEGICGTCIVEVDESEGQLSEPTQQEIDFLGENGVKRERMCCQCRLKKGKVTITN